MKTLLSSVRALLHDRLHQTKRLSKDRLRPCLEVLEDRLTPAAILSLYNTGVDAMGNVLADGAADPHYSITTAPSPVTPGAASVVLQNGFPFGYWLPDGDLSKWIAPHANQNDFSGGTSEPPGSHVYETSFDLTGFDPQTASIAGQYAADNTLMQVLLNGVDVGVPAGTSTDFYSFHSFTINTGFHDGVNTLQFVVMNLPQVDHPDNLHNPSGLRVEMTGTATSDNEITATLTGDNHYGLYFGSGDGSHLTLVGRNERSSAGNPGPYNWSLPETWSFAPGIGDYIYVVAWDGVNEIAPEHRGGPQAWIGQFALPGGDWLLSNASTWEFVLGDGPNPSGNDGNGELPQLPELLATIAEAAWSTPLATASNGSAPWGTIPGVRSDANFIWSDTLEGVSNTDSRYVIFRTKAPALAPSGNGLLAHYFANLDLDGLAITRIDPTVSFDWGTGGPDTVVGKDLFSVRWVGQVQPEFSGVYTFSVVADDGVRLWVNDQQIIDDWTNSPGQTRNGSIALEGGNLYNIRLEYYENSGNASVQLRWSMGLEVDEVIPEERLYPNVFQFSSSLYSTTESSGTATITVLRTGDTSVSASVSYSTQEAFITSSGENTRLFSPQSGTLMFAPGEKSKTFSISISDDASRQGREYLVLTLNSPSEDFHLDSVRASALLLIVDNESAPASDFDGVNYAPMAGNDFFFANFSQTGSFELAPNDNVLANDSDYLGLSLAIVGYTSPAHGALDFSTSTGRFTYTPNSTFAGEDRFTYQVSNGTRVATGAVVLANSALLDANSQILVREAAAAAADGWKVARRSDEKWAKVESINPNTDTFESLAKKVGLNPGELASWLSWESPFQAGQLTDAQNAAIREALKDPTKTVKAVFPNQTTFWVPNTILAYWGGEVKQLGRFWERWEPEMKVLVDRGYFVEYGGYKPKNEVQVTYNNPDLLQSDPVQWHRNYNRLRAEAFYKAAQAAGTTEDPWTRKKFLEYMKEKTTSKSLYGIYLWGHGWKAGKTDKGVPFGAGMILNAYTTEDNKADYQLFYEEWRSEMKYALGAGFMFTCFSDAARTANLNTSVFSQNGVFYGAKTTLVFNLAAPVLQKILRTRMPELVVGVGEAKLTFNPPQAEKIFKDSPGVQ